MVPFQSVINCVPDSGATHYITSDLANLNFHSPYEGSDHLKLWNVSGFPIEHIGFVSFTSRTTTLQLSDVFYVPSITKNLLSMHQFTKDNNWLIEFHPYAFYIKNLVTKQELLRYGMKNGLYDHNFNKSILKSVFRVEYNTSQEWHHRLGHPDFRILKHILSSINESHLDKSVFVNCQIVKSRAL